MWHAEPTELTLRRLVEVGDYERRAPFTAVATVNLLGDGRAFVHAFLSRDGMPLSIGDLRALARKLREEFGVTEILADRRGAARAWATGRAR